MGWAAARPERTWAIEGAIGLGHLLARQLVPAGEQMLDIQPKVAGRVRLRGLASTGHRMSGSVPPPTVSISLSPRRIVGVVPMSGQRRLIRRRDCSDLSADWCTWQGYRMVAGRNNQRLSRKASSGSGGW